MTLFFFLYFLSMFKYVYDCHAKCHNSSSIITIKQETKHRISLAVMLFYNIKAYLEQKLHVFEDAVAHKIPGHTIKCTSVSAILEIQVDIVLVLNIHYKHWHTIYHPTYALCITRCICWTIYWYENMHAVNNTKKLIKNLITLWLSI